jgi:hypothetical protein
MRVINQFGIEVAPGSPPNVAPSGTVQLNDMATPSLPSGAVVMFGRSVAGRILPAFVGPSGLDSILQPSFARNKIGIWMPIGNATTVPLANGIAAPTGTGTARNVATTNLFTSMRRIGYVSAGTAGSSNGGRLAVLQFWRGNGPGLGGFTLIVRFGVSDAATVANARMFVGMCASTGVLANAEPDTFTNIIGVGCKAGETTLSMYHNDGAGTATPIALGANFPSQTLSTDAYELALFCPPNGANVQYRVERLNTAHVATGTITTDLPANTQLLAPQLWRNNGATALAVGIDLMGLYIETDY